jgi:integrase
MGLGSFPTFSLDEARERANRQRQLLADGVDTLAAKRQRVQDQAVEMVRRTTFQDCAAEFLAAKSAGWKNEKHAWQWEQTLKVHVYPKIGTLPIGAIDTELVMQVLRPIWQKIPETASRVRSRLEAILDYATVAAYRPQGPNPAKWGGAIEHLLSSRGEMAKSGAAKGIKHHEALPYTEVPDFMHKLRHRRGRTGQSEMTAIQVEWAILTACRVGELRGAKYEEFDWERQLWTIPAERMKSHREHVIPLSDRLQPLWEECEWQAPQGNGRGSRSPKPPCAGSPVRLPARKSPSTGSGRASGTGPRRTVSAVNSPKPPSPMPSATRPRLPTIAPL